MGNPNDSIKQVKNAWKLYSEGFAKIREAEQSLNNGPARYYFEKIEGYIDALFNRFSPFRVGHKVKIIKAPNTDNSWSHCKHFLVVGNTGTVKSVDYIDNQFRVGVEVDNQTWFDFNGIETPTSSPYVFCLREHEIEPIS